MVSFSLVSVGASLLGKPLGFLTGASIYRISAALPAAKSFSTTSSGPPKRPKTSYMYFSQQQWPVVARQYPDVKAVDLSRKIGQQWRELTPEEKRPFEEASVAERKLYSVAMERYKAQLTPAQAVALKEARREKMAKRKAVRKRRELRNLGKPKRPKTALNIFIAENFTEAEGASMLAKSKTLMDDWKKLTAAQKQVYLQQAEDDKIRYKNEIKAWEDHMREIGRDDLIRRTISSVKKTTPTKRPKKISRIKSIRTKVTAKPSKVTQKPAVDKTPATLTARKTVRKSKREE